MLRTSTAKKSPGFTKSRLAKRDFHMDELSFQISPNNEAEKDQASPMPTFRCKSAERSIRFRDEKLNDSYDKRSPEKLPSLKDIMSQLRPSRELLEYYRSKIDEYDEIHNEMAKQLNQFKSVFEEQHALRAEVAGKEQRILDLQRALGEMQVAVYREKEAALRIQAENDKLKIQEVADRKKIQQLLALGEPCTVDGEITYFLKEPPNKPVVRRIDAAIGADRHHPAPKANASAQNLSNAKRRGKNLTALNASLVSNSTSATTKQPGGIAGNEFDNDLVQLQIEALEAEMEEQERLYKDRLGCVAEEAELRAKELEIRHEKDAERIQQLADKLKKTQELLYDSTQGYLELQAKQRKDERKFMAEREQLLAELERAKVTVDATSIGNTMRDVAQQSVLVDMTTAGMDLAESLLRKNRKKHSQEVEILQNELRQAQEMADVYREQVVSLEDENGRLREKLEMEKQLFKDHESKLLRRVEMAQSRYRDLERRRNLEVEGFNNDVKQLRSRLKSMEQQLYQLTLGLTDDSDALPFSVKSGEDGNDVRILKAIRKTNQSSKKMLGELRGLKTKVYHMEDRVRKL